MFDFEVDPNAPLDATEPATTPDPPSLPLVETPRDSPKPKPLRTKAPRKKGIPPKLASLRPASLPAPSAMPPARPQPPSSARTVSSTLLPAAQAVEVAKSMPAAPMSPHESEILKLVAADVPSHRGAWAKDGRAWRTFVSRRGDGARVLPGGIDEAEEEGLVDEEAQEDEDEDDEDGPQQGTQISQLFAIHRLINSADGLTADPELGGIPRSLPVAIRPFSSKAARPALQPKTSLADRPGVLVPALRAAGLAASFVPPPRGLALVSSSAAARRASYAERDLRRAFDPGALDFAAVAEDEEPGTPGEEGEEVGGRGRQRALKILQARSELPDEGMWRSLAN